MDIVYVVGRQSLHRGVRTPIKEELRYSLRSLVNLDHDQVWIAGFKPRWLTNIRYINVIQRRSKWENSTANIEAACAHPEVSEDFVYFNDDFFVMAPMKIPPVLHRGRVAEVAGKVWKSSVTQRGARDTARILEALGVSDPLCYEVHVPLVINKRKFLEALNRSRLLGRLPACLHKRTLYGNYAGIGGRLGRDVKVHSTGSRWHKDLDDVAVREQEAPPGMNKWPLLSTSDHSFAEGEVGKYIRAAFPEPSRYERWGSVWL